MSEYVVSYYDNDGHIFIYEKDSSYVQQVLGYDSDVVSKINSVISIDDCIVKFDQNKDLVILESNDASTKVVFRFCDVILEKPELSDIKNAIIRSVEKNGAIDITDREIISQTPSRTSKRSGSVAKTLGSIMLYVSIAVTPFAFLSGYKRENPDIPENPETAYSETITPEKTATLFFESLVASSNDESNITASIDGEKDVDNIVDDSIQLNNWKREKQFFENIETIEGKSNEELVNQVDETEEQTEVNVSTQSINDVQMQPEVNTMPSMHLEFGDLSETDKAVKAKTLYYEIIKKYSHKYGLDPNLVLGMATQERGVHSNEIDAGGGIGLMQVQYSVWVNNSVNYYELNDDTGEYEKKTMTITDEKLRDVETNIQIGCIILQDCLLNSHYNIPIAVQMYNVGIGEIYKMLDKYRATNGLSRSDILDNPMDSGWLDYRISNYLEAINQWVYDNWFTVINVKTGEPVSINFTNDNEQSIHSRN